MTGEKLRAEIATAINRCSAENGSNTPDFILAEYLTNCLAAFDAAIARREKWYGYELSIGYSGPARTEEDSHTVGIMNNQPTPNAVGSADWLGGIRRYTKKPVTIEAAHLNENNAAEIIWWIHKECPPEMNSIGLMMPGGAIKIRTMEGDMLALPGDWVIKGVKGEFYPCKPDIFEAMYSAA